MGPWYKRVNSLIAQASQCDTLEELIELLGEPDELQVGSEARKPSDFFSEMGSIFRFGDENADVVVSYADPYRNGVRYKFGVEAGKITSKWKDVATPPR